MGQWSWGRSHAYPPRVFPSCLEFGFYPFFFFFNQSESVCSPPKSNCLLLSQFADRVLRAESASAMGKRRYLENMQSFPLFTSKNQFNPTPTLLPGLLPLPTSPLLSHRVPRLWCLLPTLWGQESNCSNLFLPGSPAPTTLGSVNNSAPCSCLRRNWLSFVKTQAHLEYELLRMLSLKDSAKISN